MSIGTTEMPMVLSPQGTMCRAKKPWWQALDKMPSFSVITVKSWALASIFGGPVSWPLHWRRGKAAHQNLDSSSSLLNCSLESPLVAFSPPPHDHIWGFQIPLRSTQEHRNSIKPGYFLILLVVIWLDWNWQRVRVRKIPNMYHQLKPTI